MIERQGGRLHIKGSITLANVVSLLYTGLNEINAETNEIDLGAVDEVDSSAISMLLEWTRSARRKNCNLRFINIPNNLKNLADVYGVLGLIPQ